MYAKDHHLEVDSCGEGLAGPVEVLGDVFRSDAITTFTPDTYPPKSTEAYFFTGPHIMEALSRVERVRFVSTGAENVDRQPLCMHPSISSI
jgi:hypothetical protein